MGDAYFAVYRQDGVPDRVLDGADGRPRRFASATAAINAGRLELLIPGRAEQSPAASDWHVRRLSQEAETQIDTFGGVIIRGRVVPVERRR